MKTQGIKSRKSRQRFKKEVLLAKIKIQLNKSSEFTAFKRYIIRNNKTMKQDFEKYIKD